MNALLLSLALTSSFGQESNWPKDSIVLKSDPTMVIIGDPGPGWRPPGEDNESKLRQNFYYRSTYLSDDLSMFIIEADCSTVGKWRIRTSVDMDFFKTPISLSNQLFTSRSSNWVVEENNDVNSDQNESEKEISHSNDTIEEETNKSENSNDLGLIIWANNCLGPASNLTNKDPFQVYMNWYTQKQSK